MSYQDLHPQAALEGLRADPELRILDVRTAPEFDSHHLEGALLLPLHELQERCAELDADARWLVTCEHGVRSVQACEFLAYMGFGDLRNLQGGMARWLGDALPLKVR
jgi:rhodanese-related sulfurtransferase